MLCNDNKDNSISDSLICWYSIFVDSQVLNSHTPITPLISKCVNIFWHIGSLFRRGRVELMASCSWRVCSELIDNKETFFLLMHFPKTIVKCLGIFIPNMSWCGEKSLTAKVRNNNSLSCLNFSCFCFECLTSDLWQQVDWTILCK